MWFVECPLLDQGLIRPLVTSSGEVVLMCDSGGEVWLRPEDVERCTPYDPEAPEWRVVCCITVEPGTTRWGTSEDVARLGWEVEWHK